MCGHGFSDIPLPSGWAKSVKSAVLHVVSLAHFTIVATRGWATDALNPRARQAAAMDGLTNEVALLREELRIKDGPIGHPSTPDRSGVSRSLFRRLLGRESWRVRGAYEDTRRDRSRGLRGD